MMLHPRRLLILSFLASAMAPAYAQQTGAPTQQQPLQEEPEALDVPAEGASPADTEEEAIIVIGQRLRGQVAGDIPPEVQLSAEDLQAYGAGSVSELLDALSPLTQSARGRGQGRPIVLLNGRRTSGFSEIRDLPPEAVERVDIMPEEVALKYGYRADQRVVNFVLRENFNAITTELQGGLATAGGRGSYGANVLRIDRDRRFSLDVEYRHQDPLFESERDIVQANPDPLLDLGDYRTLLAESDEYSLNGTYSRGISEDVFGTVNARLEANTSESFIGLPPSGQGAALTRQTDGRTGHLGLAVNGDLGAWRWSLTGNLDRGSSETVIETGSTPRRTHTVTQAATTEMVANGRILELPAGEVATSIRVGLGHQGLRGETMRSEVEQPRELSRGRGSVQANLDVPVASRRRDFLSAIGDLSANLNAEVEQLSDFGTLRTVGGGINWSPIQQVRVIASVTNEDGAPTMQQLGDPAILVPNTRVFDLLRGETVDIARLEGGNPDISADNRRVFKLGVTARPLENADLTLRADYTASRINNPIASFPTTTPEIEAAFPDRFVRDADGRLLSIDSRPVNFERSERQELRWGLNYSKPLGDEPPRGGGRGMGQGGGGPGGGGGFGGRGGGGSRLQLGIFHTWRFQDEILIRQGVPELDLLNGSAVGNRGGQPRHQLEFQAGVFKNGLGARFTTDWQSGTLVRGGRDGFGGTTGDLSFGNFMTANLRLFADLGQQRSLVQGYPWLKGTRVTFSVDNLFDSRLDVRDQTGAVPLSYQPNLLDPLGRSVRVTVRKQF